MNGEAMAAFMEGFQRTKAMMDQQRLQRDELGMRRQDRQQVLTRQSEQDRIAAEQRARQEGIQNEDRQRSIALQGMQVPGNLAELGGTANDPSEAQRLIESMMPAVMKAFGPEALAYGQPAVEMAQRTITARQKKDVERFVEQAIKTSFIADNPDADPVITNLPEHVQKAIGKSDAKLSELQGFAELPVGRPAKPQEKPAPFTLSPGATRYDGQGQPIASAPERPPKPTSEGAEPLMAIIGPDGQPIYVPRSQAVGKRPASTREQGRAVIAGDASDIAEFNTALDDVATLRDTLKGINATGTSAAIGAAVPNAITEMTGWGTDAKQKNAVISRVKQVIGKALEGGVLRKEDESKYAKILPTISDTKEVVATKLDGLEKAIQQRQQNKMDALADAGYDTSRFETRRAAPKTPPPPSTGPKAGERRKIKGVLAEWDGKGWLPVR